MALCQINKSIKAEDSCAFGIGGVKRIALFNYDADIKVVGQCDATETTPEGITFPSGHDGKFYGVSVADESVNYTDSLTVNGSQKYLTQTLTGIIDAIDCNVLDQWKSLCLGKFGAVVQTNSDKIYVLGVKGSGLKATQFEFTTGAGNGDASGVTFTFEGVSYDAPVMLSEFPEVED